MATYSGLNRFYRFVIVIVASSVLILPKEARHTGYRINNACKSFRMKEKGITV